MGSNQYTDDGEEEAAEAQNRIDQILGGGAQNAPQQPQQADQYTDDPLGGGPRVELRSRAARSALGLDDPNAGQGQQRRQRQGGGSPSPRAQQAIMVIGGILVLGIVVVGILILLATLTKPGGSGIAIPFLATATSTPTETATPTSTPTPTATVPPLTLPNLTCLVQTGVGCLDYCQSIDNLKECDAARVTVETTDSADFAAFLKCLEPAPGPNTGNAQSCLEDSYRSKHP